MKNNFPIGRSSSGAKTRILCGINHKEEGKKKETKWASVSPFDNDVECARGCCAAAAAVFCSVAFRLFTNHETGRKEDIRLRPAFWVGPSSLLLTGIGNRGTGGEWRKMIINKNGIG